MNETRLARQTTGYSPGYVSVDTLWTDGKWSRTFSRPFPMELPRALAQRCAAGCDSYDDNELVPLRRAPHPAMDTRLHSTKKGPEYIVTGPSSRPTSPPHRSTARPPKKTFQCRSGYPSPLFSQGILAVKLHLPQDATQKRWSAGEGDAEMD